MLTHILNQLTTNKRKSTNSTTYILLLVFGTMTTESATVTKSWHATTVPAWFTKWRTTKTSIELLLLIN